MKERPILFSGEMVKAILEGRKTQTRRVAKIEFNGGTSKHDYVTSIEENVNYKGKCIHFYDKNHFYMGSSNYPYGLPGDRLWVRETWAHDDPDCNNVHCEISDHIWYKASENKIVADSFAGSARWKPSIFMPRWASRITLEIVNIRVERVQDIDMNGMIAEGIHVSYVATARSGILLTELHAFKTLWDSINAKRGYSWESNPWVWVVEFKRAQ